MQCCSVASLSTQVARKFFQLLTAAIGSEKFEICILIFFDVVCRDARVMWDQKTGRSRGFGFVSFRNQQVLLVLICELVLLLAIFLFITIYFFVRRMPRLQ